METQEITLDDVVRAGRILFGPSFTAEAGGWREALRSTYRRRAMETHPDRARALGRGERELLREFGAVTDAYRILSSLRAGPLPRADAQGAPSRPPPRPGSSKETRAAAARWAEAPGRAPPPPRELPRQKLRFAEFLYYSGRVRWSELVDAIAWQRAQRPPVGRIAVRFGFLAPDDVGVILERRREAGASAIPFGEWAMRLGYLTPFQLLATLGQQLRLQRPIGRFFVEHGLIAEDEVDGVRRRIIRHNSGLAR